MSADNPPKNTPPRWVDTWARDTVRKHCSADTLFWQLSNNHNVDVRSVFLSAPKLARKGESKHWFLCGAHGRSFGRCMVAWLPNSLRWVDLLTHGAPPPPPLTVNNWVVQKASWVWKCPFCITKKPNKKIQSHVLNLCCRKSQSKLITQFARSPPHSTGNFWRESRWSGTKFPASLRFQLKHN